MRTFLVVTEQGRIKGNTSVQVFRIEKNFPILLLEFNYSNQSNKGVETEVVSKLVEAGKLSTAKLGKDGFIDYKMKNYGLVLVESKGLNYVTFK